jgi:hypothetical protein
MLAVPGGAGRTKVMNRTLFALPLAALCACSSEAPQPSLDDQNQERAEQVAKTADPDAFVAGRWETKTEIGGASNSGLDSSGKKQLAAQTSALDQCLPPDEVRRPDPNFFAGGDASECKYTRFAAANARLDATMVCTATPGSITITLAGSYTPTSYALDSSATTSGPSPMTTTAKLSGTWLGPCGDPDDQRAPEEPKS